MSGTTGCWQKWLSGLSSVRSPAPVLPSRARRRQAVSILEARQDRPRVKELERELHCKDKALAETAALLVLCVARPSYQKPSA